MLSFDNQINNSANIEEASRKRQSYCECANNTTATNGGTDRSCYVIVMVASSD